MSQSPDFLGLGQYQTNPWQVDQTAFSNPLGNVAPQLGTALSGYTKNAYQPVTAATSPYTDTGTQGQISLAQQYGKMAAGQGPSLANVQAQQQGDTNLAQAESMLGSARGAGSPAAAQLAARNALTQGQQQVAENAVQGRTQEELGAMGAQGNLLGQVAGTGLQQQAQQNQVAQGNQATNAAAQQQYLNALVQENAQQQQGAQAGQQLGSQNQIANDQLAMQAYQNAAANNQKLIGTAMSAAGGAAAAFGL